MKPSDLNEDKAKSATPEPTETVKSNLIGNKIGDLEITNQRALSAKALVMRGLLAEQPLEKMHIQRLRGEAEHFKYEGSINGLRFAIPKGKFVQVPVQVAEMIYESLQIGIDTTSGHSKNMANQSDEAVRALS